MEVPIRSFAISQEQNNSIRACLLLDGQQRLTSLSAIIRGEPVHVRGRQKPIELLFNLEHPDKLSVVTEVDESSSDEIEEGSEDASVDEIEKRLEKMAFVVSTSKLAAKPHWVKVSDVFKANDNTGFIERAGVTSFKDPCFEKYNQRLNQLRDIKKYVYRVDLLDSKMPYPEVTEIFVRVNSLGAKLKSSDLALAQITAKWQNSLSLFESFRDETAKHGFDLELGVHLRNLIAFATGQCRFHTVANLSVTALKESWEQCKNGMQYAVNFVSSNADMESEDLLTSPFLLITVAYYGHCHGYRLSANQSAELRYWLYLANAKGRYSRGSSETILDQDIVGISRGEDVQTMIDRIEAQFGRLDFTPADLIGRNSRSGVFKTMFLAFRASDACDWATSLKISLNHSGNQHKLQFHHIFPRKVLEKDFQTSEINDICNLAFIGSKTNQQISDLPPFKYIKDFKEKIEELPFQNQCIPLSEELLLVGAYSQFLEERRKRVVARLNQFVEASRTS